MTIVEPSFVENMFALFCIVVVSLFGFISNGLSLHITITNSHFRNAYGTLCTAVLLCNIQTISVILIWGAVVLLTHSRELSSPTYSIALIPGCLANVSLYGAVMVNLLITMNRYCALAYPLKYHNFWSIPKARRAGIIAYFLGFLPCLPNILEPCTPIFNAKLNYCWTYSDTTCGQFNSVFDVTIVTSSSVIMGCINFATFIKVRNHYKSKTIPMMRNNFIGRRKLDLLFFKQVRQYVQQNKNFI
uniref:G-protein coupled receptors family 1 profile domain-containing protein n=1 Tax=Wuchereria bancrofti TaxID=6293 RepID=A0AAF5PNK0_WUCBA